MFRFNNLFCYVIGIAAVITTVQSKSCYFCNTEVDGQSCNDPINPNVIQVQDCSNLETTNALSAIQNVTYNDENDEMICITLTYTYYARNVTSRGCELNERFLYTSVLDICQFYQSIRPSYLTNFECAICTGDLCNYVSRLGGNTAMNVRLTISLIMSVVLILVLL